MNMPINIYICTCLLLTLEDPSDDSSWDDIHPGTNLPREGSVEIFTRCFVFQLVSCPHLQKHGDALYKLFLDQAFDSNQITR